MDIENLQERLIGISSSDTLKIEEHICCLDNVDGLLEYVVKINDIFEYVLYILCCFQKENLKDEDLKMNFRKN